MKQPAVYILANQRNGTLYIGITRDLIRRTWKHKEGVADGFTKKYNTHQLVYFEFHADFSTAIAREKAIKKWRQSWKIDLIEKSNPAWEDLYYRLV